MSTEGVEALIKRAVEDSQFRQRVESNPEEVFPEFDLTVEEQEAIKRVQKRFSLVEKEPEEIGVLLDVVPLVSWLG
jgi:serine phosphatase RsbU (regulator of sigma subunit)